MSFLSSLYPEAGDLVKVKRKAGYSHYGIAVGNEHVIHFTGANGDLGEDEGGIMVRETSLASFANGDQVLVEKSFNSPFKPEIIVERAKNAVGSTNFRGKPYNFVTNNCEHFARYIFSGRARCTQVRSTVKNLAAIGGTAIVSVAGAVIINQIRKSRKKHQ